MKSPLNVAILWHMHQPDYRDPATGRSAMPWVRLHALKGYFDMLHVLQDSHPDARAVFNFVPSLVSQLTSYIDGTLTDDYLELSRRPTDDLGPEDREFVALNFFHANHRTMVDCYPRYRQLRMMSKLPGGAPRQFANQDLRDLVVWFNLTWLGYTARREYPLVDELIGQGHRFTEGQKNSLLDLHMEIAGRIIPEYRAAVESGIIELTTTPYYHPILPLLIDSDSAKDGLPGRSLPDPPFSAPEDAHLHVKKALDHHEQVFGTRPEGMWPAEGSVSQAVVELLGGLGIKWIATDQDILFRSRPKARKEDLYKPWSAGKRRRSVNMVFRDRDIADAIGFRYSQTTAETAVNSFMTRLMAIAATLDDPASSLVTIVLDGENAWEYYPDGGEAFLSSMYRQVAESPLFRWTTIGEHTRQHPPKSRISKVFPGSWIGGNFDIWIGSDEENRAWDALRNTRIALVEAEDALTDDQREQAWELVYGAEGSDWFWWFGDDFSTALKSEFDRLFRARLAGVYRIIGEEPPSEVRKPIHHSRGDSGRAPSELISPTVDGEVTDFYEWVGAGQFDSANADGAMARGDSLIQSIYYGADHERFCLRIDTENQSAIRALQELSVVCEIMTGTPRKLTIGPILSAGAKMERVFQENGRVDRIDGEASIGQVFECAIPLLSLGLPPGSACEFLVSVTKKDEILERWPLDGVLIVEIPSDAYELDHWSA
jgi:alpha-amylase/alpha-mannosidase (GH57 family)